jgi:hypothetical protein
VINACGVNWIFVTPPGGKEQTVGSNFAFRTEQNAVTALDAWGTGCKLFRSRLDDHLQLHDAMTESRLVEIQPSLPAEGFEPHPLITN